MRKIDLTLHLYVKQSFLELSIKPIVVLIHKLYFSTKWPRCYTVHVAYCTHPFPRVPDNTVVILASSLHGCRTCYDCCVGGGTAANAASPPLNYIHLSVLVVSLPILTTCSKCDKFYYLIFQINSRVPCAGQSLAKITRVRYQR